MISSRLDVVAERLRHLLAVLGRPTNPCVTHLAVRRPRRACRARPAASCGTSRGTGRCLRGTCPPASAGRGARQHALVADPESNHTSRMFCSRSKPVPPHVGHAKPGGQEFLDRALVPGVGAVLLEHVRRAFATSSARQDGLAARRAVHGGNRHAPRALARDAPVRAGWPACCRCAPRPMRAPTSRRARRRAPVCRKPAPPSR